VPLNNPLPGGNLAAEFIVSGWPWLTASIVPASSTIGHTFDNVASAFALKNALTGSDMARRIAYGFTANGVSGSNRGTLVPGESFSGDFKFTQFYVRSLTTSSIEYELAVSLTGVPARQVLLITGSNGFDGVG
jgi:hypothetical protein